MDELEAEILDTKRAVAAAQSTTELDFLRKQLLLLQEKENILLRGQASGEHCLPRCLLPSLGELLAYLFHIMILPQTTRRLLPI